jgi:hypothetical protein
METWRPLKLARTIKPIAKLDHLNWFAHHFTLLPNVRVGASIPHCRAIEAGCSPKNTGGAYILLDEIAHADEAGIFVRTYHLAQYATFSERTEPLRFLEVVAGCHALIKNYPSSYKLEQSLALFKGRFGSSSSRH